MKGLLFSLPVVLGGAAPWRAWGQSVSFVMGIFLFSFVPSMEAQVRVSLSLERSLYIAYEPLIAFISLTNFTGQDLELKNDGSRSWLGFHIQTADARWGTFCHSEEPSFLLKARETVVRAINMTPLFSWNDFGAYRVVATVFLADTKRYFRSAESRFQITAGRLLKQQEIGRPGTHGTRLVSLLVHQLAQGTALYLRIQDPANDIIYCTHRLGELVAYAEPEIRMDALHSIHVLHSCAPQKFIYTVVNLEGKILERRCYSEGIARPSLEEDPCGSVRARSYSLSPQGN